MTTVEKIVKQFGSHNLWFEEPDTLMLEVIGDLTAEHARGIAAEQLRVLAGKSYALLLVDATRFKSVSSEARQVLSEVGKRSPPSAMACFGASFRARVLVEMLVATVSLFTTPKDKIQFFDSEAEARAALARLRPEYAARGNAAR
jgi:hypothetical protein